jgi:5-methylcytosine-specific restriction endonuclease McrA
MVEAGIENRACKKCGESKPLTDEFFYARTDRKVKSFRHDCKVCQDTYKRERYQLTREYCLARQALYQSEHQEELVKYNKRYREQNRDALIQYDRDRYASDPSKKRKLALDWYRRNKDRHRETSRAWASNNKDKVRASLRNWESNNRAKRLLYHKARYSGPHKVTAEEWHSIKVKYNFTCLRCLRREPEIVLTRDHVIPISKGGLNLADNIAPLCRRCNSAKGTKIIDYRNAENSSASPRSGNSVCEATQ